MASWAELLRRIKARNGAEVGGESAAESVSTVEAENVTHSTDAETKTVPETAISQKDTVPRDMKGLGIKNVQSSGGYHSLAQKKFCCLFDHSFLNEKIGNTSDKEIGKFSVVEAVENLPIHEATEKEIDKWHAAGCLVSLQTILRRYSLECSAQNGAAYDVFQIGFDLTKHRATFALDDTHFLAIDFDEKNAAPLDKLQARSVLEEIARIRKLTSVTLVNDWGRTRELFSSTKLENFLREKSARA